MPRTRVQRVGQESASLQALELLCSSDKGLIGSRVMSTGEANYFRDYKRLGAFAKLATSYQEVARRCQSPLASLRRSVVRVKPADVPQQSQAHPHYARRTGRAPR